MAEVAKVVTVIGSSPESFAKAADALRGAVELYERKGNIVASSRVSSLLSDAVR